MVRPYDYMQEAKDLARAERELQIERWVYITFEYRDADRTRHVLHKTDLPQKMLDRWQWLIEWRRAKLICRYPRKGVQVFYCHYDKRTGLQLGFDHLLSRVAAAKVQITKTERHITEYIDYMTRNDLFFDPETDEKLHRAKEKLLRKKTDYADLHDRLRREVEKHRANPGIYKLFVGFDKLGEFRTIQDAERYAAACGRTGIFTLIGDRYRDSWYQAKQK